MTEEELIEQLLIVTFNDSTSDENCNTYCREVGLVCGMDGTSHYCHAINFFNLQKSICGFGDDLFRAIIDYHEQQNKHATKNN